MEVTRRQGRRRKKLLDDVKDRRGYSHLKEEALHRTMWRHRFGGGFGLVVRQNTVWMNELLLLFKYNFFCDYLVLDAEGSKACTTQFKDTVSCNRKHESLASTAV